MTTDSDKQREALINLINQHIEQLGEHFETVQIFVTIKDTTGDGTAHVNRGTGNYFARYGQVQLWLAAEQAAHVKEITEGDL